MNVRFTTQRSAALLAALAVVLGGCASTPKRIQEIEAAQAVVAQVSASPRAGIAAANISEARKSLDRALQAADRGQLGDAKFHANVATAQAQIANEKILTAQAQESLAQGAEERQRVLAEARTREADLSKQQADISKQQADMSRQEADRAQQRAASAEEQAEALDEQLKDLQTRKTERGLVLTLGDVLFDTGKANLKPGAYATIDRLATVLKEVSTRTVMIEGHTDSMGAEDYNQQLSEQRAMAVQSALMQRGVNGSQISTAGKGEGLPVASNDSAGGRQQNRRVEVIFVEGTPAAPRIATDTN
jgi:outer membrane protein OmpA-like peptidoglycan-associated protein